MEKQDIIKQLDKIDDLPTLPSVALEINKMLEDYDTSINDLTAVIEKDQAVVSKILKLVNSAFFGLQSKVSNISHAITLLGFNTVRNAAISVSVMDSFAEMDGLNGFSTKDFWAHSISVAVTSRHLADMSRLHPTDDCFIGGLLHDMGKLVLLQFFEQLFKNVWVLVLEEDMSFFEAEKKEGSVPHSEIGCYLAKKWQLPVGLVETIGLHHSVGKESYQPNLMMIVHVADAIVNRRSVLSRENGTEFEIDPEAEKALSPQLQTEADWWPAVSEEIELVCKFFIEEN